MNVKEIFEGIAANLLVDFDQIQAQIDHDGERGAQREKSLSDFLAKYLPKKYALGSGQVIDKEGHLSKQCDIVIYDAFNCPLLLIKDGYQLFPAESVFGVVEVKSTFSANTLAESVQNIQSVKRLVRKEPIAGCVFAYRSEYKTEPRIDVAAKALRRVNRDIPPRERVDLICILADGLLREYKADPDWGEDGSALEEFLELETSTIVLFLYLLIGILEQRHSLMPSLIEYAAQGGIGTVRVSLPTDDEE